MKTPAQTIPSAAAFPQHQPPPNFNRLARLYRSMELLTFGPWLHRCRCSFLPELSPCRNGLILGDGDGRFTARLLATNSAIRIDAVDASSAMLRSLLRRAGPNAVRVRTHQADIRAWHPIQPNQPPYDLVVSHFFLDCLTTGEVHALAAKLRKSVSPSAIWLISDFSIPAGRFGQLVARPIVWSLYRAFSLLTGLSVRSLPAHRQALQTSGFQLEQRRPLLGGLLVSELWRFRPSTPA